MADYSNSEIEKTYKFLMKIFHFVTDIIEDSPKIRASWSELFSLSATSKFLFHWKEVINKFHRQMPNHKNFQRANRI